MMDASIYFDGRHYDALFPGGAPQAELDFYLRRIREFGEPVLELGCGTGRLTIPLAQAGIQITGLDLSTSMLALAVQKATQQGVSLSWVQADCRSFALEERFGTIFFPANALLHLVTWTDLQACLHQIKQHLRPGGGFVFEIFNPRLTLLTRDPHQRYPVGEYADPESGATITVTENNVYDAATQINHIVWYYRTAGKAEERSARLDARMYYPQEMDALLHYNRFEVLAKYGDYDETPFGSAAQRQLIVCKFSEGEGRWRSGWNCRRM